MTTASTPSGRPPDGPHVVHVATRYSGGAMRRLLDVVAAVDGRHTVVLGAGSDADRLPELAGRADVVTVEALVREVAPRHDARALADLVALLRRLRPDVVHTHQAKAGLLGRVAARAARVPVVYHSASMASFGPGYGARESTAFRVAERATAPLVSRYFVVGRDLADRLADGAGVPARKLEVVRSHVDRVAFPPVDGDRRDAERHRRGLAADAAVVAYVGSLEPRKGVTALPALLAEVGRPVTLLVAGTGPLRDELAAAAEPGVEVRLLGHVDDVGALMAGVDLILLPSTAEGVPQVLVQAAMAGVPFVAHEVDGVAELLDLGAAGAAVPLGDAAAFSAAVRRGLDGTGLAGAGVDDAVWSAWSAEAIAEGYRAAYAADLARARSRAWRRRGRR